MDVIQPVVLTETEASTENVVDTTLVYDWRFRNGQWTRRCRIVAREFKTTSTDENNFSPTSSFASVRMLLVLALIYGLAITALDVKDAFLMVPQMEISLCENSTVDQAVDRQSQHSLASQTMSSCAKKCGVALAPAHWTAL